MAFSGSYNQQLTAANVITAAFENLGVISAGGTVASADSTTALTRLGLIAKQYSGPASGVNLQIASRQRVTLALAVGQQSYLIGPASTDSRASTLMGRTTISANEAASQTVISITSNTDTTSYPGTTITMANSDIVGIELNDGTIQWTTISGTPGATMTIGNALTSASDAGRYVWWFTSRAQRLIYLESALLRDENFNDTPLPVYGSVQAYAEGVASKFADGDPTEILFEPLLLNSRVTLNSQPTDITKQIVLVGWYAQQDYDATTDDIAFPQEAFRWLCWELTYELAPVYGASWTQEMERMRLEARQVFLNTNSETSDAYFKCGGP